MAPFSLLSLLIGAGLNEAAVEINWPTAWQIETVGCVSTLKSFEADQKEENVDSISTGRMLRQETAGYQRTGFLFVFSS
jgi:hypothetical protein